jgi:glutathione S-transferase
LRDTSYTVDIIASDRFVFTWKHLRESSMILVGQFDSFPTRRIGITLTHYGMSFERDTRSIFSNEAELSRINPLVRIPALILDDGEVLIDSTAILDMLDEIAGKRALVPRAGPLRRRILQATALAQGIGEKAAAVVYERYFHPPEHVAREWEARCLRVTAAGLLELEHRAEAPWYCGSAMSHADIMVFCTLGYLRLRTPEVLEDIALPRLEAIEELCAAVPAVMACPISTTDVMPQRS